MTRNILLAGLFLLFSFCATAQDMKEALKKTFIEFDSTRDLAVKKAKANKLELIAKKWNDEWAPHYYNAYAKAQMSFMMGEKEMDEKDLLLDKADEELAEAIGLLGKENDETYVMKAMLAQARMAVDGRNRWMKYGKLFDENLRAAKEINENNPRIYYLKGTATYFTPKAFGGGAKKALEYFEKAQPLFDQEAKGDATSPYWGDKANEYFIQQCTANKDDKGGAEGEGVEE